MAPLHATTAVVDNDEIADKEEQQNDDNRREVEAADRRNEFADRFHHRLGQAEHGVANQIDHPVACVDQVNGDKPIQENLDNDDPDVGAYDQIYEL